MQERADQAGLTSILDAEGMEKAAEEAIRLAGGDARAALAAALVANAYLEAEIERLAAAVAKGYVRGRLRSGLGRANRAILGNGGEGA
jgi:hypothetical protein